MSFEDFSCLASIEAARQFLESGLLIPGRRRGWRHRALYREQVNQDDSGLAKVLPYSITDFTGLSPHRRWVMASIQFEKETLPDQVAIPLDGGLPKRLCTVTVSPNGHPMDNSF